MAAPKEVGNTCIEMQPVIRICILYCALLLYVRRGGYVEYLPSLCPFWKRSGYKKGEIVFTEF